MTFVYLLNLWDVPWRSNPTYVGVIQFNSLSGSTISWNGVQDKKVRQWTETRIINYKEIGPHIDRLLPLHTTVTWIYSACKWMNFKILMFVWPSIILPFDGQTKPHGYYYSMYAVLLLVSYSLPKKICWFIVGTKFSTLSGLKKTIRFGS